MPINNKTPGMERRTRQRDALLRVFAEAEHPLTPDEVLKAARRYARGLGIATVYRTLKLLAAEGRLTPVQLPQEPVRYEPADRQHHHHFRCDACGRVFEMHGCPADLPNLAPPGFAVRAHDITLYGLCRECRGRHTTSRAANGVAKERRKAGKS